jgi:hypothetical protein
LASQLRFEGPELEDLLERVRRECGADAHIIAANRVRKGGVGGFFAKEGFEVVVELPNGARPPSQERESFPRRQSARVPASVLDLADEVSDDEADQVIDLSEQPARVSTESQDFGSMLAHLTRELDREDEEMPLPPRPAPTREQAPRRDAGANAAAAPAAATVTLPEEELPVSPREHYRRVTPAPDPEPQYQAQAAVAPPVAPAVAPYVAPQPVAPIAPQLPAGPARPDPRLAALGLPLELVPSVSAQMDLRTALWQRLSQLPPPPMLPRTPGVTIAVVGIGTAPIALARRLADELDIQPENIVLATPEPVSELSHPDEAEVFRRSCRRRSQPTVIACSIGAGRAQLGWAHRMLDRLEPTITWAVVEASCKPEDIGHRIGLLGGVDVIALTGIADTISPAAVLQLGIPVGRLGATPATPAAWSDLLMERLDR